MSTADTRPLALAYIRVSTDEQVEQGASLDAQAHELTEAAERKGYRVEIIREEGRSAKDLRRPALQAALARLASGEAAALLTKRLDRLSRSVADFAALLDRSRRQNWDLIVLDADVDTSTPSGEFLLNVLASAAQFERRIIAARTRDALAQRRREGKRLGRPSVLSSDVVTRVLDLRQVGASLRSIAEILNGENVPTAHGGAKWYASTVRKLLAGQDACAAAA